MALPSSDLKAARLIQAANSTGLHCTVYLQAICQHKHMLQTHLHASGAPDACMWHVPVPPDLIAGVHNDHPPLQVISQQARQLPDGGGLTHTWATHEQHTGTTGHQVCNQTSTV